MSPIQTLGWEDERPPIDQQAALYSCSWGLAQVMGFNHKLAGFDTVEAMVAAFMADEEAHLQAAVTFIKNTHLDDELRAHNWAGFANGYNGENYRINAYDTKLADAFRKWSRIANTPWPAPTAITPPTVEQPTVITKETGPVVVQPQKDATVVVVPDKPTQQPSIPRTKNGLIAFGAIVLAIGAAIARYFFGG